MGAAEGAVTRLQDATTRVAEELGATALRRPLTSYDDPLAELYLEPLCRL